ncbi:hypothetical protein FRC06_003169 [Ceratobasidium sp. 370]|nr:hypothetical protein FRC06_003169 [Ceratobasidium sp. 370]
MPSKREQQTFHEMSKELGSDLLSLSFFGMTIIVLNSAEAAADLLEKRANIYSNRVKPVMVASPLLVDLRDSTGLMNPSERWRKHRKIAHSRLNKQVVHVFHAQQQHQAKLLLQRISDTSHRVESSEQVEVEFDRTIASTVFDLVYGYPLKDVDDPFLIDKKTLTANLNRAVVPSNFLVNIFPALAYVPEWFPGAGWKRTAREWREQKDHTIDSIFNWAKTQVVEWSSLRSITASTLKELRASGYDQAAADDFTKNLAETLYEGATDTLSLMFVRKPTSTAAIKSPKEP